MRLITAVTFALVIIVASAVSPQAQNPPAAPVTNAPGIIVGRSTAAIPLPIVVLVDGPALSAFADVLAGLKVAGVSREERRVARETAGQGRRRWQLVERPGTTATSTGSARRPASWT